MYKLWWLLKLLKGIQKIIHLDHIYQLQEVWLQQCWIECLERLEILGINSCRNKEICSDKCKRKRTEQELERYSTYKEAVTAAQNKGINAVKYENEFLWIKDGFASAKRVEDKI